MQAAFSASELRDLLAQLGALLADQAEPLALVIVGGAALNLAGTIARRTADVDVLAIGQGTRDQPPAHVEVPAELPPVVLEASARLARDLGLPPGWLNAAVGERGRFRLPEGFAGRVAWQRMGGLWLGIAGRQDLIAMKLHAAADQDPRSRHTADLRALRPTGAELDLAAAWVRQQDASPAFPALVAQVIAHVRADAS